MKKVIDYSITPVYFYRFVCNDPNIVNMYVGSSFNLTKRKNAHKSKCNNLNAKKNHLLVYKTIRENGGWENWRMLEIENKIVKDKTESKQREQYWIEFYNAQMNMIKAQHNQHEYNIHYNKQHREKLNANAQEYREQHREELNAKSREYANQHRGERTLYQHEYYEQNKEQKREYNREYYEQNKATQNREQINAYQREYRVQNKDQINAKRREQYKRKKQEKQNINELV
jgi:hypothetical protein